MNLDYYLNILVCEYLYDENSCISFIDAINENRKKYEHIYKIYNYLPMNKSVRKLSKIKSIKQIEEYKFLLYLEFNYDFNEKNK
jgi:hypothetical protein